MFAYCVLDVKLKSISLLFHLKNLNLAINNDQYTAYLNLNTQLSFCYFLLV